MSHNALLPLASLAVQHRRTKSLCDELGLKETALRETLLYTKRSCNTSGRA